MFRSKKYNMSRTDASRTLQNVFTACNREPNVTNFDILILRSIAQTNLVSTCKWIAKGLIFLVLIAPVALLNTNFKVDTRGIVSDKIIIEDHQLYTDHFVLIVHGEDIAYDNIYARNIEGDVVFPNHYDVVTGEIDFPYNNESLTIFIPDKNGHVLTATLSEYDSSNIYVEAPDYKE